MRTTYTRTEIKVLIFVILTFILIIGTSIFLFLSDNKNNGIKLLLFFMSGLVFLKSHLLIQRLKNLK